MPEIKLGNKYDCYSCGTKFYDLGKAEPICPKCGANQKDASQGESASTSQASRGRAAWCSCRRWSASRRRPGSPGR